MNVSARTILHVFSTLNVGGPQIRFVQLANHFGSRYRHLIVAMDRSTDALKLLNDGTDTKLLPVEVSKGKTLSNVRTLHKILCAVRPDLLVTSNWGSIEWALANIVCGISHIHMEDGFGPEEAKHQLSRRVWIRRLALRRSLVTLPSRKLLEIARKIWKLPPSSVVHIPNGIDCSRFLVQADLKLAMAYGIRRDVPVIGTIGGLRPEKNLFRLLEAFANVVRSRPAQLVIVGDGSQMQELKLASRSLGISKSVVFTGSSSVPEKLLPLFSVFVLSSDTEQMPLSILEAMAASRAIASTDVGDIRDMVSHVNRPFIVSKDSGQLSDAILKLLKDPVEAAQIGCANRERAITVYNQDAMFEAYRKLFDETFPN